MVTGSEPDDLFENAPCGFISFTDKGTIVKVNRTLLDYLGYSYEEIYSKNIEHILTIASRIFYQTHFFPLIRLQGTVEEIFLSITKKNGEDIPVLTNAKRLVHADSFIIHCILIPVTQRGKYENHILQAKKIAEDALHENKELIKARQELELHKQDLDKKISMLEQKNSELVQVNKIISHDLQEPLRKINLFTDLLSLETKGTLTRDGVFSLEKIKTSSNRIRQIIFNLERLVSLDVTEKKLTQVDLNNVLTTATSKLAPGMNPSCIQAEHLPVLEGYYDQLEILFYNLLENSIKFRHPERDLFVQINCSLIEENSFKLTKGKYKYIEVAKITFADNGIGFENTYRENIFLILKKLNNEMPGLGFGLAFCKKIVDNHFGSISAESIPDKGSVFTVSLPLQQFK